ncbi:MAG: gliding motility-associated C-terminal domain-containing protein, partial [Chitinophagaceae bacterium]
SAGCFDEHSFTITITAKPVADAPADVQKCGSYILPALTNGAYYTSPNGAGSIPVGTVITATQTIYVYAGSASCFDEHSFTVTITPVVTPSVSISASSTSLCLGNSVTFTATPVNPGPAPTYQWKLNGIDIPGATSLIYTTNALNNGDRITFVMVSNAPCATVTNVASNEIQVTVSSVTPAVSITASSTTICTGISITFTASSVNGGAAPAYQWQINGVNVPGATLSTYTTTTLNNDDKVTVVMTSNANCTTIPVATSNQIPIVVNPLPVVIITNPAGVCAPGTVNITASAVTSGSDAGLTFTYFTDAAATSPLSNANAIAVSGTYYIKGTNAAGCISIKPVVVIINPLPNLVITNPAAVCSPATIDITALAVTAGSDAGLSLTYFTDAAATSVLNNPNAVNASGTYYIKATTIFGCVTIKPVIVIINPLPTAVITGSGALCRGLSKTLDITLTGTAPWTVTYSDGTSTFTINSITVSPYNLVVSPTVNTTYSLISVVDPNCSNTATGSAATISVGTPIPAVRYPTINATANLPKQLQARIFTPTDRYTWDPAVGLNAYSIDNPIFNYDRTTEYLITIEAGTGCTVVDTLLVNVFPASGPPAIVSTMFVPKAWSPNRDGHNDKLTPLLFRIKEIYYFRIFNRWGQLVFETKTRGEGWDGIFKGIPQGTDVFTWTAAGLGEDGRTHNLRGQSILLR